MAAQPPLPPPPLGGRSITRLVLRAVLVVLAVVGVLLLVWLLRKPLTWLIIAAFLAIALSGPVNWLDRRMRRGFAIAITYLALLLVPVAIGAIVVPPLVREVQALIAQLPQYAADVQDFAANNRTLRSLDQEYQITERLQEQARRLPSAAGDAAGVLSNIGVGVVNSVFAGVTILLLSIFMVAGGRTWVRAAVALQPPDRARRLQRVADRMAVAVGNYVAGAAAQATLAGVTTFLLLTLLGVPFAAPLALLVTLFDLVPLVGATLAAIVVGIVTVFHDFPTATIVWVIWSIVYQQIENNVIQPQIQRRALDIHPFVVLVSVLFGATLFGVLGALLAIPVAATLQIALLEWWDWRRGQVTPAAQPEPPPPARERAAPPDREPPAARAAPR